TFSLPDYIIFKRDRNLVHTDTGRFVQGGGCYLDVKLTSGSHLLLSCVCRRPNGHTLFNFFNVYSKYSSSSKNSIIAGDLNRNLLESTWASNHFNSLIFVSALHCVPFKEWIKKFLVLGLEKLDLESKLGTFFKSDSPFISGHDFLFCEYLVYLSKPSDKTIIYRNFKNCDHTVLSDSLLKIFNINDNDTMKNFNPNDLLTFFLSNVIELVDEHAPFIIREKLQIILISGLPKNLNLNIASEICCTKERKELRI
ncbi:Protein of unknown function, partial [Cotesia congregata]